MNPRDLQIENERLKELLSKAQREREEERQQHAQTLAKHSQAQAQHTAVAEQFTQTLAEKDQQVASRASLPLLRRATTRDGFRTQRATRTYSRSMEGD